MLDQAAQLRELVTTQHRDITTKKISVQSGQKKKKEGSIIAITSGKGGVGKTNFVINVGLYLARLGKKVAIVDLDLGLANVDIILNVVPKYTIDDVIRGRKMMDEIFVTGPHGVVLVPGGSGFPLLADLTDDERDNFIRGFSHLREEFDYILLDTAAGISKNVIEFVLIADDAIVVTTPEPTAITDAYAMIKVIGLRNKDLHIKLMFNMVQSGVEAERYYKKIQTVIRQFLHVNVDYLGYVTNDSCVRTAIMKRKPFSLIYPFSSAARSVQLVARNIVKNSIRQSGSRPGILERVRLLFG